MLAHMQQLLLQGEAQDAQGQVIQGDLVAYFQARMAEKRAARPLGPGANPHRHNGTEEYVQYRRRIWATTHPNEPMPALPDVQAGRGGRQAAEEEEDADLVITGMVQSTNCPITVCAGIRCLLHPARSAFGRGRGGSSFTPCRTPHTYTPHTHSK